MAVGKSPATTKSPAKTATSVKSPTSTEVKSPTSTKTSTEADTKGNITVTGGAGRGAYTRVIVNQYPVQASSRTPPPKK